MEPIVDTAFIPKEVHLRKMIVHVQEVHEDDIKASLLAFLQPRPEEIAWLKSLRHLPKSWGKKNRRLERARLLRRGYFTPEEMKNGHRMWRINNKTAMMKTTEL